MRYISTNKDGSVEIWSCVPLKIVRNSDNAEIAIAGVRRKNGQCFLYGNLPSGGGFELSIGDETLDVSALKPNHIEGHTLVFPTFEYLLAKQHPDRQAQIESWREATTEEVREANKDRSFRKAWRDGGKGKGLHHDMPEARKIHLERLRSERNKKLDELDKDHTRATGQGKKKEADEIEARRQTLRDMPTRVAPALEAATTIDELKEITME